MSEFYGGGGYSDFGGNSQFGALLGARFTKAIRSCKWTYAVGAEYAERKNNGEVVRFDMGAGELLYRGPGRVSLKYLSLVGSMKYKLVDRKVVVSPFFGGGLSALVSQEVDVPGQADGAFDGFDWYRSVDVLLNAGVRAQYRRVFVDFRYQSGLLPLGAGPGQDGSGGGAPFTAKSDRLASWDIFVGVAINVRSVGSSVR